jgi:hypothetical protein
MPELNPISLVDTAHAASATGTLLVSAGGGAVPTFPASLTWDDVAKILGLAAGAIHHDVTAAPSGADFQQMAVDPARPGFRWGSTAGPNTGGGAGTLNPVVGFGYNIKYGGILIDQTKVGYRVIAAEGGYWDTDHEQFEGHLFSALRTDGIERRALTSNYNKATDKVSTTFVGSTWSYQTEADLAVQSLRVTATTTNQEILCAGVGAFQYASDATTDSAIIGRGTVATGYVIRGSAVDVSITNDTNTWRLSRGTADPGMELFDPYGVSIYFLAGNGVTARGFIFNGLVAIGREAPPNTTFELSPASANHYGLTLHARASQAADLIHTWNDDFTDNGFRLNKNAYLVVGKNAAPADAELNAGEVALWFDKTNGAAKLMCKGKSTNGTVVTGNVPLA